MADDSDPATIRTPRARTQPGATRDRDELSDAARAERALLITEYASDDVTGQVAAVYDDEAAVVTAELAERKRRALREARATRPPEKRLEKIEEKQDEHGDTIAEHGRQLVAQGVILARIDGVTSILPQRIDDAMKAAQEASRATHEREHVVFTQRVDIDTAQKTGDIRTATAEKIDGIDKKRTRREIAVTVLKIFAGIAGGGGFVELLHRLGGG